MVLHLTNILHLNFILKTLLIDAIKGRCLRCLTGTSWGASKETLIIVYRGLIRSILEYAPFIYANVCKTHFHELELIQNKCLRLVNGAFRSTPAAALQVESGELPLQYRFKFLNIIYSLKCINAYAHPAHDTFDIPLITVYPTTSLSEIYQEYVNQINIPVLGFRIPPQPPWQYPRLHIDTNLKFEIAKDTPGYINKSTALEYISRWPMHLSIYTDGSKVEDKVAYGI